jgi:predicted DNA-binding protein (UPF0251 family)
MTTNAELKKRPKAMLPRHKRPRQPSVHVEKPRHNSPGQSNRPHIELTEEEVGKLKGFIIAGTPMEECAQMLGVSADTLARRYMDQMKAARVDRNLRIRLKLFNLAMDGNVGALIWLSKQWCGMREQVTLGMDPDMPFTASTPPLIELVFMESDGDGRAKIIEATQTAKELTDGKSGKASKS